MHKRIIYAFTTWKTNSFHQTGTRTVQSTSWSYCMNHSFLWPNFEQLLFSKFYEDYFRFILERGNYRSHFSSLEIAKLSYFSSLQTAKLFLGANTTLEIGSIQRHTHNSWGILKTIPSQFAQTGQLPPLIIIVQFLLPWWKVLTLGKTPSSPFPLVRQKCTFPCIWCLFFSYCSSYDRATKHCKEGIVMEK